MRRLLERGQVFRKYNNRISLLALKQVEVDEYYVYVYKFGYAYNRTVKARACLHSAP